LYLKRVGKTFQFECSLCQYHARVVGGADHGWHCEVQTVICRDCRQLFDVYTRVQRREKALARVKFPGFDLPEIPPAVLLNDGTLGQLVWQKCSLACPINPKHVVEPWNDPGRCPRCGNFLEKNGFPFRRWD
jgi:hypothetical protein